MASSLEDTTREMLKSIFPFDKIQEQYHIKVNGRSLFFDFYVPNLGLMIECQGEQHYKFVSHFHETTAAYRQGKWYDSLKREWAAENNKTILELPFNDMPGSAEELFDRIYEVLD